MALGKKKIQMQGSAGITNTDHFDIITYTGNGNNGRSISGLDFSPDLVWFKNRSIGSSPSGPFAHYLYDSTRGAAKHLELPSTSEEQTNSDGLTSFNSNGFTIGDDPGTNYSSQHTYVAWAWKAGDSISTNSAGGVTSYVNVNDDAGFAIVRTTSEAGPRRIGHGMASTPELIIGKKYGGGGGWWSVYHHSLGSNQGLLLQSNAAQNSVYDLYDEAPTSTYFKYDLAGSGNNIFYCFYSIPGFSKVGSYGASTTWGTSVTVDVGFPPKFVLIKAASNSGSWLMVDSKRGGSSGQDRARLFANSSGAEGADTSVDFSGNTFSITYGSTGNQGASGSTYVYYAVA